MVDYKSLTNRHWVSCLCSKQFVWLHSHEKLSTHEEPGSFVRPGFVFFKKATRQQGIKAKRQQGNKVEVIKIPGTYVYRGFYFNNDFIYCLLTTALLYHKPIG
jgi:hypothetical protein